MRVVPFRKAFVHASCAVGLAQFGMLPASAAGGSSDELAPLSSAGPISLIATSPWSDADGQVLTRLMRQLADRFDPSLSGQAQAQNLANQGTTKLRALGYPLAQLVFEQDDLQSLESTHLIGLHVFLGEIGKVSVRNGSRVSDTTLQAILEQALCPELAPELPCVLRSHNLERASSLVANLPGIENIEIAFSAQGVGVGQTQVVVSVTGVDHPVQGTVSSDNDGLPSTGKVRAGVTLSAASLLSPGDSVSMQLADSEKQDITGVIGWVQPLGARGLRLDTELSRTMYSLPQGTASNVNGTATSVSIGVVYPLVLNLDRGLSAQSDIGIIHTSTNAATLGTFVDRKIPYADLTLSGNSGLRSLSHAKTYSTWSATLTYGHPSDSAPGAKAQDAAGAQALADFGRLSTQLLAKSQLGSSAWTAGLNLRWQMATRNLDSSQALSVGGPTGVRGYRLDEGSFDDGVLATLDLARDFWPAGQLKVTSDLFIDYADGQVNHHAWAKWNAGDPNLTNHRSLSAYGMAIGLSLHSLRASLTVAHPMPGSARSLVDPTGSATQLWASAQYAF